MICVTPPIPRNGVPLGLAMFNVGEILEVTCLPGFSGGGVLTCGIDGVFAGVFDVTCDAGWYLCVAVVVEITPPGWHLVVEITRTNTTAQLVKVAMN